MVFHGRRDLGTIQTYVAHGGRGAGAAVGAGELLRVPCDLDLGDAERPRGGRAALRRAGRRAARRAGRRRHRARHLARAARGAPARARRGRPPDRPRRPPARPPAAAGGARAPETRHGGDRRVRRASARRGPAADGDRLRPAGRRARVPAARRPGALPGGLPGASRPSTRASAGERLRHQEASVERFLELSGDDFPRPASREVDARRAQCPPRARRTTWIVAARLRHLRLPGHLVAARARPDASGAERAQVLDAPAGAGARGRRRACSSSLPACAREPACAQVTRARVARLRRPGRGADPQLQAVDRGSR